MNVYISISSVKTCIGYSANIKILSTYFLYLKGQ